MLRQSSKKVKEKSNQNLKEKNKKHQEFLELVKNGDQEEVNKALTNDSLILFAKDQIGKTALGYAIDGEQLELINIFMNKGLQYADPISKLPALHYAIINGKSKAAEHLIKTKKNNLKDKEGASAIHYAAAVGRIDLFKLLVIHGHNPCELDGKKDPPIAYAERFKQANTIIYMLKKEYYTAEYIEKRLQQGYEEEPNFVMKQFLEKCYLKKELKRYQALFTTPCIFKSNPNSSKDEELAKLQSFNNMLSGNIVKIVDLNGKLTEEHEKLQAKYKEAITENKWLIKENKELSQTTKFRKIVEERLNANQSFANRERSRSF